MSETATCVVCRGIVTSAEGSFVDEHGDCPGAGSAPLKCQNCHENNSILVSDPYMSEIYENNGTVSLCPECFFENVQEI